jgi:hypothetical protein
MASAELLTTLGKYATLFLTVVAGSWLGTFIGSYLKKKGENLASREDIEILVHQMAAITQTTKEIEARISDEAWDRQKLWEMKREVLFEAVKRITEVDNALLAFSVVFKGGAKPDDPKLSEERLEMAKRWLRASAALDETRLLVAIVCGKGLADQMAKFAGLTNEIVTGITGGDTEIFGKSSKDLGRNLYAVMAAIRAELGIGAPDETPGLSPPGGAAIAS